MKITAGIGSSEDFELLSDADGFFCGYVPHKWSERWGLMAPANRRESVCVPVQVGSLSELKILSAKCRDHGKELAVTVNSPWYLPEQYSALMDLIDDCIRAGVASFIAADPALLLLLHEQGLKDISIHISGELGEMNSRLWQECIRLGAKRLIFHRYVTPENMASIIASAPPGLEYEAFLLNERCRYHGGWCMTLHCDEFAPMCREPYCLGSYAPENGCSAAPPSVSYTGTGEGGCGLCALPELKQMGVTHLKLVSRGALPEKTAGDIRAIRKALTILEEAPTPQAYRSVMKQQLFPEGCSGNCYYLSLTEKTERYP